MLSLDSLHRPGLGSVQVHERTLIGLLIALTVVALTSTATRVLRGRASGSPLHYAWVRIGNARRAATVSGRLVSIPIPLQDGTGIIIVLPNGRVVLDSIAQVREDITHGRTR